ncbi:hypothetical protein AB685_24260 [Bacillus sp. LL01]|uniref:DNA translocase FtsK n=1 Tax=Bacillus sp. LL01 TaxID=1665556 RepID=UPI00064D6272|nr:DNA translocase FtsK [Bacillus sp. LL01]KMJ56009.1 hypothetical protein AB685_24260 [Bacillus sp. LL01]
MKRIQGALFGEEEIDKQNREDSGLQQKKQISHDSDNKRKVGYIEGGNRESVPRMVYQYPKPGKFRFPLIEDGQDQQSQRSEKNVETRTRRSFRQVNEEQAEEKSYRRPDRNKHNSRPEIKVDKKIEEKAMEKTKVKKEFKPTSIPSPVYGFKERKKNMYEDESLLSSLPGFGKVIETKRPSVTMEKQLEVFLRAENIRNTEVAATVPRELEVLEPEVSTETEVVQQEDTVLEEHSHILDSVPEKLDIDTTYSIVEEEPHQDETKLHVETAFPEEELTTSEDVMRSEKQEQTESLLSSTPPEESVVVVETTMPEEQVEQVDPLVEKQEVMEEPSTPVSISIGELGAKVNQTQEEEPSKVEVNKDEPLERPQPIKKASEKKEAKESIPFNVMMLPQDRKPKKVQPQQVTVQETYQHPSIQLLKYPQHQEDQDSEWLAEQAEVLEETLQSFNVDAKVVNVTKGPSVTRYEIQPARGVKVNKVTSLTDDMKLALAAKDIRIEAPIPGKNTIGIEVPNRVSKPVFLREILRRDVFIKPDSPLTVALGLDISGQPIVTDLRKMPHGLVAGATGSGKSVCINSVLISLLYKANPDEVKLLLIDPKMVELAPYNKLPHLVTPVITDAKQATAALKWVVGEMERRYELFSQQGVRDVSRYNELYSESKDKPALPYMLVVIDELADLMMVSPQDVEDSICRIAQKARACGIHLLLATQRPSVDVITGLIKANIPTRVAFSVSSQTDSRTILDMSGAERLLGKGDMLFHENGAPKPVRVQGTFVSDEEIEDVLAFVKKQREPEYLFAPEQLQKMQSSNEQDDDLFEEACYFVVQQGGASASSLQRRFRVGYNRAARLIDMMEGMGVISEAMGSKPRHILVDELELEELLYPSR